MQRGVGGHERDSILERHGNEIARSLDAPWVGNTQSLSLPGLSTPLFADELTGHKGVVCEVNTGKDHLPVIGPQNIGDEALGSLYTRCILESARLTRPYYLRNRVLR